MEIYVQGECICSQSIAAPCGRPNGTRVARTSKAKAKASIHTLTTTTGKAMASQRAPYTTHTRCAGANTGGNSRTFQIY